MQMKARFAAASFGLLLLARLTALASDNGTLERKLDSDYASKVLTLRNFYKGSHLRLRSDGTLIGSAPVGSWTAYGQVQVKTIRIHDRNLRIRARRIFVAFDSKTKPGRDVLDLLRDTKPADLVKLEKFYRAQEVELDIELASDHPEMQDILSALKASFLSSGESMTNIVPPFWRSYFAYREGVPDAPPSEPVYSVKTGEVSPPRPTYSPNPSFSDEARNARYQGTVVLSLVVDSSGTPKNVRIVTPLGLGLDENAVSAVNSWQFKPALRGSTPVPVQIMIEVDFHLF